MTKLLNSDPVPGVGAPAEAVERVRRVSLRPAGSVVTGDVVRLNMGEPDFDTPQPIIDAAVQALAQGYTHYVDLNGDPELRALIAGQAGALSGREVNPDQVLISHGGAAGITSTILATVNPGDRVIIPEPTYSLYVDAVALAGGVPVQVPNRADHHLDLAAIDREVRQGAALITICNPVNPTGAVFSGAELAALGELLQGTDTLVMVDEAYANLIYSDEPFTCALAVPELAGRLVYVQTLSKTYAMTGWRIGYVIAEPVVAEAIRLVHRTFNSAVNAAVQRAAITALTSGDEFTAPMRHTYAARRDLVLELVDTIPGASMVVPEGAFYAFVRYPGNQPSTQVAALLAQHGVIVRAGAEYGPSGEGHVRLSFAAEPQVLREGLRRMGEVFASL